MIDLIHRQTLVDQLDTMRHLCDSIAVQLKLVELFTESADREKAIDAGVRLSELAIELDEFVPSLCDTAARFDLVALAEAEGVSF
jgi:hypothetical protein